MVMARPDTMPVTTLTTTVRTPMGDTGDSGGAIGTGGGLDGDGAPGGDDGAGAEGDGGGVTRAAGGQTPPCCAPSKLSGM